MTVSRAVRCVGVSKYYGEFAAVEELSFDVPMGVVFGFLGPNGAGKSTTLRMINDIIAPDVGRIELFDELRPGLVAAKRIGYLPEERGLYPRMGVAETLVFFAELRGLARASARRRAAEWLERLDLADWSENKVQDLSKGMQQKVQFAAAVIHDPDLLILDEPWSGLDPLNAEVLRDIVLEHRGRGKTVVFSTHLMEQAEKLCDHVCIVARGKKIVDGTLEEVRREAAPAGRIALSIDDEAERREALHEILARPGLVDSVREKDGEFEVQLPSPERATELFSALASEGIPVRKFEHFVPSLHQIFVEKVGAAKSQSVGEEERD